MNQELTMSISFPGKYKSLSHFEWKDIPKFAVITGTNGSGKSQLLELLADRFLELHKISGPLSITNCAVDAGEVTYIKGEWKLNNIHSESLSSRQQKLQNYYQNFKNNSHGRDENRKFFKIFENISTKLGKRNEQITLEEFTESFPASFIESDQQMGQQIAVIFHDYYLQELQLRVDKVSDEDIKARIGEKPWLVLREIIQTANLPFGINDPEGGKIISPFQLTVRHLHSNEIINLSDLSSGEKVLFSLVFYLYNSQEKKRMPKLMLLDEPDAHLHPSMSQQFLDVIQRVFVEKYHIRVILTTHSPSTVILVPEASVFIMSREAPRIRKAVSKNEAVSLLTAGLVYVGEGTKFFIVEDKDDMEFYQFVNNKLVAEKIADANIPLVFIPASTKTNSGGKSVVDSWIGKFRNSGLTQILYGLIDQDSGNTPGEGIYMLGRYSIESFVADPLVVYAALLDQDKHPVINDIPLAIGDEAKIRFLEGHQLAMLTQSIIEKLEPALNSLYSDIGPAGTRTQQKVIYSNNKEIMYPEWLLKKRGKDVINKVYNIAFPGCQLNYDNLFHAFKRLSLFPSDLISLMNNLRSAK